MRLHVNLPELRRLAELVAASSDKADRPLRDRLLAVVAREVEGRAARQRRQVQQAAAGGMKGGNGAWF